MPRNAENHPEIYSRPDVQRAASGQKSERSEQGQPGRNIKPNLDQHHSRNLALQKRPLVQKREGAAAGGAGPAEAGDSHGAGEVARQAGKYAEIGGGLNN